MNTYSKKDYDKLMSGSDEVKEDMEPEEPKKKKLTLKQLFDGDPKKIIKKKKKAKTKEKTITEKTKLIKK